MSKIKLKIETVFSNLARILYRHRLKTLIPALLFLCALVIHIPDITIDTTEKVMLHESDPEVVTYDAFLEQFGSDKIIVICITAEDIFSDLFLKKLKSLHVALEDTIPRINAVHSLINARYTQGKEDELIVEELLEDWPDEEKDLAAIRNYVMHHPGYINSIVSEDGHTVAILLEVEERNAWNSDENGPLIGIDVDMDSESVPVENKSGSPTNVLAKQRSETIAAVYALTKRYEAPQFKTAISGISVITDTYNRYLLKDMIKTVLLSTLCIFTMLALLFRRLSGVIIPSMIVYVSLFSTLALMAISNTAVTIMTVLLPGFIMVVGVADAVHILAIFYKEFENGRTKEDAIAYALGHSGLAIVITSLTTAAGLLSFSFAELAAIAELGIFSAAGVFLALIYTLFLLPAILSLTPLRVKHVTSEQTRESFLDNVLLSFANFSITHPKKILTVSTVLFLISLFYIFNLKFSENLISYFPDNMAVKQDLFYTSEKLNGIANLEIVVDTHQENGIYDPDLLNRIERCAAAIRNIEQEDIYAGKITTITEILKEINQALHNNDPKHYSIPQDRNAIAQEFLLFENSGSDDLEKIVDSRFSKTRISIKAPWVDYDIFVGFIEAVKREVYPEFQDNVTITITGGMVLFTRILLATIRSMAESYGIAFVVISIMMILLLGSFKIGLLSMIPNLLPLFVITGFMGFAGIAMNMNTIMIVSIAIGLVVDDTVHFMYNFQKYYDQSNNAPEAIRKTLLGTGRAMLFTSLILCCGFFSIMAATLKSAYFFGLLTGVTILLALIADFVLAPALMLLVTRLNLKPARNSYSIRPT